MLQRTKCFIPSLAVACGIWIFLANNLNAHHPAHSTFQSPWGFQDRLPVPQGKMGQSFGFQFGVNGISPSGSERDSSFLVFPYSLVYGLFEKLEINARWGVQSVNRKNKGSQFGITDLATIARYRFFEADRRKRMPGLAMDFGFSFPTASFDRGLGTGGLGILFGWGLVLPLDPVRAHFALGFRYNFENADKVQVGNVFSYNGGVTYPLKQFKDKLSLRGELKGFNHARNRVSGSNEGPAPDELYLSPGANWEFHKHFRLLGTLLIGLTAESSDVGMNLELQF